MLTRRAFVLSPLLSAQTKPFDQLAANLGGRGAVLHNGRTIHAWGDQKESSDWLSSAKPVLSTLLFFAIHNRQVKSVHTKIATLGWPLTGKDREITFHHLANMISGYARPDKPGTAWAYNDYAINLYQQTLFDKVFAADPDTIANKILAPLRLKQVALPGHESPLERLGARFRQDRHLLAQQGQSGEPPDSAGEILRPLSASSNARQPSSHAEGAHQRLHENRNVRGRVADHFTDYGAGIYGYNWWFNATGRLHPQRSPGPMRRGIPLCRLALVATAQ